MNQKEKLKFISRGGYNKPLMPEPEIEIVSFGNNEVIWTSGNDDDDMLLWDSEYWG